LPQLNDGGLVSDFKGAYVHGCWLSDYHEGADGTDCAPNRTTH